MRLQGHHQRLSNASTIESESEIANMLSLARQVNGQHQKTPRKALQNVENEASRFLSVGNRNP
jgi:hypothetical protein